MLSSLAVVRPRNEDTETAAHRFAVIVLFVFGSVWLLLGMAAILSPKDFRLGPHHLLQGLLALSAALVLLTRARGAFFVTLAALAGIALVGFTGEAVRTGQEAIWAVLLAGGGVVIGKRRLDRPFERSMLMEWIGEGLGDLLKKHPTAKKRVFGGALLALASMGLYAARLRGWIPSSEIPLEAYSLIASGFIILSGLSITGR